MCIILFLPPHLGFRVYENGLGRFLGACNAPQYCLGFVYVKPIRYIFLVRQYFY